MCIKHGSCRWYLKLAMRIQAENINTWPSQSCTTEPFGPNMFLYLYLYALPDPTACHFHGCPLSLSHKEGQAPGRNQLQSGLQPTTQTIKQTDQQWRDSDPSFQVRIQTFLCNIFVWKWGGKFDLWIWPWMKEGKQLEIKQSKLGRHQRHFW